MVKAGLGATVLPRWSIAGALTAGGLRAVRITRRGVFRKWYAVTLSDITPTPFMEAFVDLLRQQGPTTGRPARRQSGRAS